MGILHGVMGNATECSVESVREAFEPILLENEVVEKVFKIIRDEIIFTNKRLVLVDKQGLTAKKVEFRSIPYKNITSFAKESAGMMDLDAELKLWISKSDEPITIEFSKKFDINEVYKILSSYILN